MRPKLQIAVFLAISLALQVHAQKDTIFWFAAPSIAQGVSDYDRPVVFRISSYESSATVIVSQPANPGFPPQILNLPAQSTTTLDLTPYFNSVENFPADVVLKKGFRIESTAPVSVYYEVIGGCECNPEIFSLKGSNALGTEFFVPFQTSLPNTNNIFNPLPSASFEIVATENNTTVQITPTRALVGHPANVPYSINLQKGESYSGQAAGQAADQHPTGTHITANKPISVSMKDDLLEGFLIWGSHCKDLVGDQLVPVNKVGKQYVIIKGKLNGNELAYVVATQNNTEIFLDGASVTTLNRGEAFTLVIAPGTHFLEGSFPVYLLQMTGIGCETSAALLPSIECSGSNSVRFVRTTDEDFYMFIAVRTGFENDFMLNGNAQAISPAVFQLVPGSNGAWKAGLFQMDQAFIPVGLPMEVENTADVFHLGILNGAPSVTGTRFGFFSDFDNLKKVETQASLCESDTIFFRGMELTLPGLYSDTVRTTTGCDTVFRISVANEGFITFDSTVLACLGDTLNIAGQIFTNNSVIADTIISTEQCDTILRLTLVFLTPELTNIYIDLCQGSTFSFKGGHYTAPFVLRDTLSSYFGCDSFVVYDLRLVEFIPKNLSIELCHGDSTWYNGSYYTAPATLTDTLPGAGNCDTLLTITLQPLPYPVSSRTLTLCPGQSITIGGIRYSEPGIATDTIAGAGADCDTIRTTILAFEAPAPPFLPADTFLCPGDVLRVSSPYPNTVWNGGQTASEFSISDPGLYIASGLTDKGCPAKDTLRVRACCDGQNLYVPNAFSPNDDGFNDHFRAFPGSEWCADYRLRIYDRWGELLYEANTPTLGWDGVFRGREMPGGIYVWVIEIYSERSGRFETLKGDVLLVR